MHGFALCFKLFLILAFAVFHPSSTIEESVRRAVSAKKVHVEYANNSFPQLAGSAQIPKRLEMG